MDDSIWVILGVLLLMGGVAWLLYRQHQALVTFVSAQGWHWVGSKAESLPSWLTESPILKEGMADRTKVSFRNIFTGTYEGSSLLGVERVSRRRSSSASPTSEYLLCLFLPSQRLDLPFVGLNRAHPLTNFLVQYAEYVDRPEAENFALRLDIPGYDAWVVQTTPAGCQWLAEAHGQYLAAGLSKLDGTRLGGFSMSGRLLIARGPSFRPKDLQDLYAELQSFYRLIARAPRSL